MSGGRQIVWQYGQPGVHGTGPNRLWNPDDGMLLPDGNFIMADIKNCRVLLVKEGDHQPAQVYGQVGHCVHRPPSDFGSPNGAFPLSNGDLLVTEIRGDWVDEITRDGRLVFSTHPPGVLYPSDTVEVSPGRYLMADYSRPGRVVVFDQAGNKLWIYQPSGMDALNHPSLALPLGNGDIILNDDRNHRVIVVDLSSNRIVWQYGVTGVPGRSAGLLDNPDGLDLVPPNSLMWLR